MSSRQAFTLAESLAAVTLSAMLATAAVPVLQSLSSGEARLIQRQIASALLDERLARARSADVLPQPGPLDDRDGWRLAVEPFLPEEGAARASHGWWRIAILDARDHQLAESIVLRAAR